MENKLVTRYFKCSKCKLFDKKLIPASISNLKCNYCKSFLKEMTIEEFNEKLRLADERNKKRNQNMNTNINQPIRKTNINKDKENEDNKIVEKKDDRSHSSLHYSTINMNSIKEGDNTTNHNNINNINNIVNNNNINNIKIENTNENNNINQILNNNQHIPYPSHNTNNNNHNHLNNINMNIGSNNINDNNERREIHHHHHHRRGRDHSLGRALARLVIGNIIRPNTNNQNRNRIIIANVHRGNPFRIMIQRQKVPHHVFDPRFTNFGAEFNGVFQDNFSSNFRSNFRGNFANELLRILHINIAEARRRKRHPISKENLDKLKRFEMNEKYCKVENDKSEVPNCCICLDEISLGSKTVLLPCGHLFHDDCIVTWFKNNNTCPICRFEIK